VNGAYEQVKYSKLNIIAEIFRIYLKNNPNRKDDWYGKTFDVLYDKSLIDLNAMKDVLLKSK
jgi:hypothetical protein